MKVVLLFIILIGFFSPNRAQVVDNSESAILMEVNSKRIIYSKNIDQVHLTASIAKIMTAIVAIENGDLDKLCTVDQETVMIRHI